MEEAKVTKQPQNGSVYRTIVYILFAILFWFPLLYLVRRVGFSEANALIAASIGVGPLLLLFVPLFDRLSERLSSLKIGDVELGFKAALAESLSGMPIEPVEVLLDDERMDFEKGDLAQFTSFAEMNILNRTLRIVLKLDFANAGSFRLDMLYFQARYLGQMFDFRALLIMDSRAGSDEKAIIGTLSPRKLLAILDERYPSLTIAFARAMERYSNTIRPNPAAPLPLELWHHFERELDSTNMQSHNGKISPEIVRRLFGDFLEHNTLAIPVSEKNYPVMLSYLDREREHIILVGQGGAFQVRSVDRIARELAKAYVQVQMSSKSPRKESGGSHANNG